ncbi:hypothetical protein RV18_GL001408 [Enterococcus termitis]|nr:hypothetical protein RV18_GL001408 [Enterococcus termitis]
MDQLILNDTNRVANVKKTAGGKGLNVTRVLKQLEAQVIATGIVAGTTGDFILNQLDQQGVKQNFYKMNVGESRNNISIIQSSSQTEILEPGPTVSESELASFYRIYQQITKQADTIVLSGSLPQGVPVNYYNQLIEFGYKNGKKMLLDTSGAALAQATQAVFPPTLIKPNQAELTELLKKEISLKNLSALKQELCSPLLEKIEWIVLSLGAQGAVIKRGKQFYQATVPKIEAMNAIGSGDSVIAGFALGLDQSLPTEEIIRYGMTLGVLNAMEQEPGHLKLSKFQEIYQKIDITEI